MSLQVLEEIGKEGWWDEKVEGGLACCRFSSVPKVRAILQECLVILTMRQNVYTPLYLIILVHFIPNATTPKQRSWNLIS